MHALKRLLEILLPRSLYRVLGIPYHFLFSFIAACLYGFPARKLTVIGITGTKGKSTVSEMLAKVMEEAGHTVMLSSTIHFKIGKDIRPNLYKMTLPGRGFIQKELYKAVQALCDVAIIEITSEAALQYRHLFLDLDTVIFTNLQREHLESHGGIEKYFQAKLRIGKALVRSTKRPRTIVAPGDDVYGKRFLELPVENKISFTLSEASGVTPKEPGIAFTYENVPFSLSQPGLFSVVNALAVIKAAKILGISTETSAQALSKLITIPGRNEHINCGQDFDVVIDYAHTPDSLKALFEAYGEKEKICVFGSTGGGRDNWKRPEMGRIAETYCKEVILTNDDPYEEDPEAIVAAIASGMERKPRVYIDRRVAIHEALKLARTGDVVLIAGKGTDPYLMEAGGKKTPWSDAAVAREELTKLRQGLVS